MWEATPPLVGSRQGTGSGQRPTSGNGLERLGVVEVGKHVGLFHDGPLSTPNRTTPSPQQAVRTPVSSAPTVASRTTSLTSSVRSVLPPNAPLTNPFTSGTSAHDDGATAARDGAVAGLTVPTHVSATDTLPPLPPTYTPHTCTSLYSGAAQPTAAPAVGQALSSGALAQSGRTPRVATSSCIAPAHASVDLSTIHPEHAPHGRVELGSHQDSSVAPVRTRRVTAAGVVPTAGRRSSGDWTGQKPADVGRSLAPIAVPSLSNPSSPSSAVAHGVEPHAHGRLTRSPSAYSVASTATDGSEWVRWRPNTNPEAGSGDAGATSRPADAPGEPSPTHDVAAPPVTMPTAPSALLNAQPPDGALSTSGHAQRPLSDNTFTSAGVEPQPPSWKTERYGDDRVGTSLDAPRGTPSSLDRRGPAPLHTAPTTTVNDAWEAGTPGDVEVTGFYHGMSANNLERSFFFPGGVPSSFYPGAASAPITYGTGHSADDSKGGNIGPLSGYPPLPASLGPHVSPGASVLLNRAGGAEATLQNTSTRDHAPSFHLSLMNSLPDDAVIAAANHEAALLAAMTPVTPMPAGQGSTDRSVRPGEVLGSPAAECTSSPVGIVDTPDHKEAPDVAVDASPPLGDTIFPALTPAQKAMAASILSVSGHASIGGNSSFYSPTLAPLDAPWRTSAPPAAPLQGTPSTSGRPTAAAPVKVAVPSSQFSDSRYGSPASLPPSMPRPATNPTASQPPQRPPAPTTDSATALKPHVFAFQQSQVEPFQERYRCYQALKENCTDRYLTVVEQAVDSFLAVHFNPALKSAAEGAAVGGRWGRAGQRLLQAGSSLFRRAGENVSAMTGGSHGAPVPSSSPPATSPETPKTQSGRSSAPVDAGRDAAPALRYTPDVIPTHYLDERPSARALHCVALNYPTLLCVLASFFPQEAEDDGETTPLPSTTTAKAAFRRGEHVALRDGLVLPTIQTVWREYLTPLEGKATEVLAIAEQEVVPFLQRRLAELETDASAAQGEAEPEVAALKTAIASVERVAHNVREDIVYIQTIRIMDMDYCAELENERSVTQTKSVSARSDASPRRDSAGAAPLSTRRRFQTGELSQYVPVFGLILSRFHRLEMEHRTVLELWGPSKEKLTMNV